jgi:hypothetical protein
MFGNGGKNILSRRSTQMNADNQSFAIRIHRCSSAASYASAFFSRLYNGHDDRFH